MVEGTPISDKGGISPSSGIPSDVNSQAGEESETQGFENLVKVPTGNTQSNKPSPMNVAQSAQPSMQTGKVSTESFMENINNVLGKMQGLQASLQTPNLKLNARTRRLLDAKLKRTNENIRYISDKANVGDEDPDQDKEETAPVKKTGGKQDESQNAIERFVGYLTDGQSQLQMVMHNAGHLKSKDPSLMMEHMFGMQVKLYRAQVEIEFSSAVLQKAIDDLKTIMSVQL